MSNLERLWSIFAPELGEIGAAALLGNIQAESAFNPENLQNSYEKKLGFTDRTYTDAVNAGTYSRQQFAHDSAGYGLCQWTHWSRKQNMYDFISGSGQSIGSLEAQAAYALSELKGYRLYDRIKACSTITDATRIILKEYEKPADQSENNVTRRAGYAQNIYLQFHKQNAAPLTTPAIVSKLLEIAEELKELARRMEV